MEKSKMINLPFAETIGRSFGYVLCNGKLFASVAAVGIAALIVELIGGFPMLCALGLSECPSEGWISLSNILILLISVGIIVNYCRAVILKAAIDFYSWSFWKRCFIYILASLGFGLAIAVPFILVLLISGMVAGLIGADPINNAAYVLALVALVAWCIYLAPVFLIFGAICVDDKSITIKEAFRLTKGNFNKIFWGQAVMMIPGALLLYLLGMAAGFIGVESYVAKVVWAIIVLAISIMDTCFKASFFAHIYQFFIYHRNKQAKE